MGREKTTMKFTETEKKRKTSYLNKKLTLIKKAYQLSVLCNVPTCIIIYPHKSENFEQIQQQPQQVQEEEQAEVFAFEGGDKTRPITDSDPAAMSKLAREIVGRYLAYPNKNNKRALSLSDVVEGSNKKRIRAEKEVTCDASNNSKKSADIISELSVDQLYELLGNLDNKLDCVRRRIALIKGNNDINNYMKKNKNAYNHGSVDGDQGMMNEFEALMKHFEGDFTDDNHGLADQQLHDQVMMNDFAPLIDFGKVDHGLLYDEFYKQQQDSVNIHEFAPLVSFNGDFADDQVGPMFAADDFSGVCSNNMSLAGLNCNNDQGLGFDDMNLLGPKYCDRGSGFDDMELVGPKYYDQGLGFDGMDLVGSKYYDQGSGFDDMDLVGPSYYDQGSGFGANELFLQCADRPMMMSDNQFQMIFH